MGRKRSARHVESHAQRLREDRKKARQYGEKEYPIFLEKPPSPPIIPEIMDINQQEQTIFQQEIDPINLESQPHLDQVERGSNPQERK